MTPMISFENSALERFIAFSSGSLGSKELGTSELIYSNITRDSYMTLSPTNNVGIFSKGLALINHSGLFITSTSFC